VAEKLNRRWIGCDLGRWGIHIARKRLLGIKPCRPFALLNLGKYERQYWRSVNFNLPCEYVAFILKLYGAEPANGLALIDGTKSSAVVRVGAVDLPITTAEVDATVDECAKLKQRELHILGWDWDTLRCDVLTEMAGNKGIRLLLLQIPREVMEAQAIQKADVRFLPLAYLEAEIGQPGDRTARVTLKNFVILNTELIAGDLRSDWSDYIDYWAVDWDSRSKTFVEGWAAYRTRKERKLPLVSGSYAYEEAGRRRILVRVIDIFGNETRQAFDVEVS
jgi:adenine-specific DNA-methyltransferase